MADIDDEPGWTGAVPEGVVEWTPEELLGGAFEGFTCAISGFSKVGKSLLALCVHGPRYIIYLDPNRNLKANLAKAARYGFNGPHKVLAFDPIEYANFTQEEAHRRVGKIESFARAARRQGHGTLIVDGGTILKGYHEKAEVGESPTLGYRPKKGESSGIDRKQYGISNGAIRDFIQANAGSGLDFIITFEARDDYNSKGDRTGKMRNTMPALCRYAITLNLEPFVTIDNVTEKGVVVRQEYTHRIRFGENAYASERAGWSTTANVVKLGESRPRGIPGIIQLLQEDLPDLSELLPPGTPLREVEVGDTVDDEAVE